MSTIRRALVVGISKYNDQESYPRLIGSANDARGIVDCLEEHLYPEERPNWSVTPLVDSDDDKVFGGALRHHATDLFLGNPDVPTTDIPDTSGTAEESSTEKPAHELLFYFSGHAVLEKWGGELVAYDGPAISFNDLMSLVNQSTADAITIILDCCVSGGLGNEIDPFRPDRAVIREGLAILTASRKGENATESKSGTPIGSFTELLISGLRGAAADILGAVTELDLYTYAIPGFNDAEQRPTLKSHITTVRPLRQVRPRVPAKRLVEISNLFPTPHHLFPLTMAHDYEELEEVGEGENPPIKREGGEYQPFTGSRSQVELDHLKVYRDAGLAMASDGRDFWELCTSKEKGTVELTPLGRHYWTLVKRGAIKAE